MKAHCVTNIPRCSNCVGVLPGFMEQEQSNLIGVVGDFINHTRNAYHDNGDKVTIVQPYMLSIDGFKTLSSNIWQNFEVSIM